MFKMKRPLMAGSQSFNSISFGEGQFQGSRQGSLLLLINWGHLIYLVQIKFFDGEIAYHRTAFYQYTEEILNSQFLSSSLILLIPRSNVCNSTLLHTTDFEFGFPEEEDQLPQLVVARGSSINNSSLLLDKQLSSSILSMSAGKDSANNNNNINSSGRMKSVVSNIMMRSNSSLRQSGTQQNN